MKAFSPYIWFIFPLLLASCNKEGCTDFQATNFDSEAQKDDGSCYIAGCMDDQATNYNPIATQDDGSCSYEHNEYGTLTLDFINKLPFDSSLGYSRAPTGEKIMVQDAWFMGSGLHAHGDEVLTQHTDFPNAAFISTQNHVQEKSTLIAGPYNGVRFFVGVNSETNARRPENFRTVPLNNPGLYEFNQQSYVFLRIKGRIDLDGDGDMETEFSYMLAHNKYYQMINLDDFSFDIKSGQKTVIAIEIDWAKVLKGVNIPARLNASGREPTLDIISENLKDAIRVTSH